MFNSDAAMDWHGCYDAHIATTKLGVDVPFTAASIAGFVVYVVMASYRRRNCIAPFYVMGVVT